MPLLGTPDCHWLASEEATYPFSSVSHKLRPYFETMEKVPVVSPFHQYQKDPLGDSLQPESSAGNLEALADGSFLMHDVAWRSTPKEASCMDSTHQRWLNEDAASTLDIPDHHYKPVKVQEMRLI
ncbi:hypothetical protein JRQ81_018811 [Phrynocephalus forsythii]|uniref:Uncharacterized protein n=1 Tax=Phrynocephalus forsythii TaxID=171643 RepID=A0A9Q0XQ99_9SAUR|nr:hypothetical protein JRQ81_018811 [Phrynocephalus forsythii]